MNAIADRYAAAGVGSFLIYTFESHPGERYPHHASFDQKLRHARDMRDKGGVTRPILVDALDGACHRAYGSMPNMTWIVTRIGMAVYKSDWTDPHSVESALGYFFGVRERRRRGARLGPIHVDRLDFRDLNRDEYYRRLAAIGPKAVREFRAALSLKRLFAPKGDQAGADAGA